MTELTWGNCHLIWSQLALINLHEFRFFAGFCRYLNPSSCLLSLILIHFLSDKFLCKPCCMLVACKTSWNYLDKSNLESQHDRKEWKWLLIQKVGLCPRAIIMNTYITYNILQSSLQIFDLFHHPPWICDNGQDVMPMSAETESN